MSAQKIKSVGFYALAVLTALVFMFPPLIDNLLGRGWSWEGLSLYLPSASVKSWAFLIGTIILTAVAAVCIVRIPCFIHKIIHKAHVTLQVKLRLGKKHFLWTFCSTEDSLLFLASDGKPYALWKRTGKFRWALLLVAACIACLLFPRDIPQSARWFEKHMLVAHAGGTSPNGNTYSNSLEAFTYNYEQGHRVFEGDLCLTADGILVLEHDWSHWRQKTENATGNEEDDIAPISYEQFMQTEFYGLETPMDIAMLVCFMSERPDMYFMTDYKDCYDRDTVLSGFQQLVEAAQDAGCPEVLERFIIQNHHNDFKHWVGSVYPFENWVYTYYSIPNINANTPFDMTTYCAKEDIPVITMWHYMLNDEWLAYAKKYNLRIFLHTVNDPDAAKEYLAAGATGIYTDDIKPDELGGCSIPNSIW